ncbi:MAG: hypothetical protein ABIH82_02680 [Candidatus Woesearchaeota archaeon]
MDFNQLTAQFNQQINLINQNFNILVNFVSAKLKDFPNLTIGEQVSYPAIGLGLVLILISIVLFII